jgi:hypothetical protein
VNNRFLRNLFRSFSENVGGLLDRLGPAKTEKKDILQLAETLISGRGEASDVAVAREFLATYDGLTEDAVLSFLALLDRQFGPDQGAGNVRSGRAEAIGALPADQSCSRRNERAPADAGGCPAQPARPRGTDLRRPTSWKRSSGTKRSTRSPTGTIFAVGWSLPTGGVSHSFIRRWKTNR